MKIDGANYYIKLCKQLGFSCKLSFGEMFRFSELESTEVMHEIATQ